jgi:hypothetical protein
MPSKIQLQMQQENSTRHYRGYAVHPSAHRLPDGYFSANLLLERSSDVHSDHQYRFYSLDYFSQEVDAIAYSRRWAQRWIDCNG